MGFACVSSFATVFALAAVLGFFAGRSRFAGIICCEGLDGEGTGIKAGNSGGHEDSTGGFIHLDFVDFGF